MKVAFFHAFKINLLSTLYFILLSIAVVVPVVIVLTFLTTFFNHENNLFSYFFHNPSSIIGILSFSVLSLFFLYVYYYLFKISFKWGISKRYKQGKINILKNPPYIKLFMSFFVVNFSASLFSFLIAFLIAFLLDGFVKEEFYIFVDLFIGFLSLVFVLGVTPIVIRAILNKAISENKLSFSVDEITETEK